MDLIEDKNAIKRFLAIFSGLSSSLTLLIHGARLVCWLSLSMAQGTPEYLADSSLVKSFT